MSEADLSRLDLRHINFKYANLHRAKLTGANLSYCCLERTDLSQANLEVSFLPWYFESFTREALNEDGNVGHYFKI